MARSLRCAGDKLRLLRGSESKAALSERNLSLVRASRYIRRGIENDEEVHGVEGGARGGRRSPTMTPSRGGTHEKLTHVYTLRGI